MPLASKDRQWMQNHEVWQDYVKIRDDLKSQDVPVHEAISGALFQVSQGTRGSPYTPWSEDTEPESSTTSSTTSDTPTHPPTYTPPVPKRMDAKFGEVSDDSSYVAIQWVAQHMYVDDVQEDDAPDSTAYGLWLRCRESPSMMDDFWVKIWPKTVPSTKQLESQQRFRDTGQGLLELNAAIRKVLTAATDRAPSEPPAPPELSTEYADNMSPF